MAYGTEQEVAALTPAWTNSGSFDSTTTPTVDQVANWINQVSAIADIAMRNAGFVTPISDATVISAITIYVVSAVADLVAYTNKAGRFYEIQALGGMKSPITQITSELKKLVDDLSSGMESSGAERDQGLTDGLEFRARDEDGDLIVPMFRRKFANWVVRDNN